MATSLTTGRGAIALLVALVLSACSGPAPEVPATADSRAWTVTYVYDGDSMEVERGGVVEDVRAIGIDTPERGECGANEARAVAQERLLGASVVLVPGAQDDRDAYDRLLRYLEVDGEDYGLSMIDAGLAIARYDSRTGQPHEREQRYRDRDAEVEHRCPDFDDAAS